MFVISVVMATLTGLVVAGLVNSLWNMATDQALCFERLSRWRPEMPVVVAALVFSAPLLLLLHEADEYFCRHGPFWKLGSSVALAAAMSFIQGVFVITTISRMFAGGI